MRFFGILLCLVALGLTGYSALTFKAPQIEADIEDKTLWALSALEAEGVEIRVDGRHVTLEGRVASDQEREDVLSVAAAVDGALGPIDALDRQALTSPYRFGAVKDDGGEVVIEGYAPSAEARDAIEADARALFGEGVRIDIEIADGAPSQDWPMAATTGLDALAALRQGRLSMTGTTIAVEGRVAAKVEVDAVEVFAEMIPEGYEWSGDIEVDLIEVTPFTFSVVKTADGGVTLTGYVPDEATRVALIEQGQAVGGDKPIAVDIQVADGMPDEEWPSLVEAGISAMRDMEAGRFDVVDNDVSFSSDPGSSGPDGETDRDVAAAASADDAETAEAAPALTARAPALVAGTEEAPDAALLPKDDDPQAPAPVLIVDKVEEGSWSVRGTVPDQQAQARLLELVQAYAGALDVEGELDVSGAAVDDDWLRFAEDRLGSLDVVRAGRLQLEDGRAHLIGVVDKPEDIEAAESALAAIDQTMTVELQPIDPRPKASIDLRLSGDEAIIMNGDLPARLTEGEALLALGINRYDGRLDENGRGSADTWREDLSTIGAFLPLFDELDLSLGGERPMIKGRVRGDAEAIARDIVLALSDDSQPLVDIEPSASAPEEGSLRTSPLSGSEEVYRQGYWLPVVEIEAGREACGERSEALLAETKITFLRGQEDLDRRAERALNALAGLALACLGDGGLVLEIGGHTDSRGADDMNQELSQARADAVLNALVARGVDADALIAVGHGASKPIAGNDTVEGRAKNRRITFEWKASDEAQISKAEG